MWHNFQKQSIFEVKMKISSFFLYLGIILLTAKYANCDTEDDDFTANNNPSDDDDDDDEENTGMLVNFIWIT